MRLIAHRGNTMGQAVSCENTVQQIEFAIKSGFDVEVDISYLNGQYYLGHSVPNEPFNLDKLRGWLAIVYVHCKTIKTLQRLTADLMANALLGLDHVVPFYHQDDSCVLLMNGLVWVHPNNMVPALDHDLQNTIFVRPNMTMFGPEEPYNILKNSWGICSDYVGLLRDHIKNIEKIV